MHHLALILAAFIFVLSFGPPVAAQSLPEVSPFAVAQSRLVVFEGFYRPT